MKHIIQNVLLYCDYFLIVSEQHQIKLNLYKYSLQVFSANLSVFTNDEHRIYYYSTDQILICQVKFQQFNAELMLNIVSILNDPCSCLQIVHEQLCIIRKYYKKEHGYFFGQLNIFSIKELSCNQFHLNIQLVVQTVGSIMDFQSTDLLQCELKILRTIFCVGFKGQLEQFFQVDIQHIFSESYYFYYYYIALLQYYYIRLFAGIVLFRLIAHIVR
eukprot:TRINITY_DN3828_c0_g2_i11.p3 TRINITY_DN3828_c0_g2~~TRINITY_DN3828_c0_g2_i11.p3  ORF type:complete len:216 (+),score=-21.89 TRINITY_DN3828_c0_g2_i11:216-863(+)